MNDPKEKGHADRPGKRHGVRVILVPDRGGGPMGKEKKA